MSANRRNRAQWAALGLCLAVVGLVGWGVWSLPALAQGAPTPFSIWWYVTGSPPYVPVSAANPLPVVTSGSPTSTQNVNITQVIGAAVPNVGTGIMPTTTAPTGLAAAAIAPVVSASLEASHVLDAAPGNLYSVNATNLTGGTGGNLIVVNSTSVPGDGAVTPIVCVPFDSLGKAQAVYLPGPPAVFSTGISAFISSAASCFTKTTGVLTGFLSGMVK